MQIYAPSSVQPNESEKSLFHIPEQELQRLPKRVLLLPGRLIRLTDILLDTELPLSQKRADVKAIFIAGGKRSPTREICVNSVTLEKSLWPQSLTPANPGSGSGAGPRVQFLRTGLDSGPGFYRDDVL